jgi:hypothetical protein
MVKRFITSTPGESDVDESGVLPRDARAAVLLLLEVVLLEDDVVDVEPAGEARLHVVLEDDVAERLHRDQLFQTLLWPTLSNFFSSPL